MSYFCASFIYADGTEFVDGKEAEVFYKRQKVQIRVEHNNIDGNCGFILFRFLDHGQDVIRCTGKIFPGQREVIFIEGWHGNAWDAGFLIDSGQREVAMFAEAD